MLIPIFSFSAYALSYLLVICLANGLVFYLQNHFAIRTYDFSHYIQSINISIVKIGFLDEKLIASMTTSVIVNIFKRTFANYFL